MPCCWKRHFLTVLSGTISAEIYKLLPSETPSVQSLHCGNPPPWAASLKGTIGHLGMTEDFLLPSVASLFHGGAVTG